MPSGTLVITTTRTSAATYRVSFVPNFSVPPVLDGEVRIRTLEALRAFLHGIGIVGRQQENVVRAAIQDAVAVLPDVILTDAFTAEHGL